MPQFDDAKPFLEGMFSTIAVEEARSAGKPGAGPSTWTILCSKSSGWRKTLCPGRRCGKGLRVTCVVGAPHGGTGHAAGGGDQEDKA